MFFERLGEMGPKILCSALIVLLFFVGSCTESTSSDTSAEDAYYTQQPSEVFTENLTGYDNPAEQKGSGYAICDPYYPNPYNGPSITYADYSDTDSANSAHRKTYTPCESWGDEDPGTDAYSRRH